jgi:hypothetical protein
MKTIFPALFAALLLPILVTSCGTVNRVRTTTAATTAKVSELAKSSIDKLMPDPKVQVVEVREKDLQEMPLGEERALAYTNKQKRSFWSFGGPVDFEEPNLPQTGGELDGSLLPPKD